MTSGLANPHALFDVKGKVAVITGASGAFGAVAAEVLAAAGAKLVLTAGKAKELEQIVAKCRGLGAEVEPINKRPSSEKDCEGYRRGRQTTIWPDRYPGRRVRQKRRVENR